MVILSWAGMRGVVSLAAALALPLTLPGGVPFPVRDRLIFLAFCVVLGTLVVQGLTLPWVIRRLGIQGAVGEELEEERAARLAAAQAGLTYVRVLQKSGLFFATSTRVVAAEYEDRLCEMNHACRVREQESEEAAQDSNGGDGDGDEDAMMHVHGSAALRRVALDAEHDALVELHQRRELGKELLLKLERELDLAESRLPATRMPATFVKGAGAGPAKARVAAKKKRSAAAREPVGASRR
jgi:CPA1 family monovalent cation:H+ antiporter